MTTIAFDGKSISCDTMMVNNNLKYFLHTKIFKSKNFLLAGAGELHYIQKVLRDAEGMSTDEILSSRSYEKEITENASILLFCLKSKKCFILAGSQFVECLRVPVAIGSGGEVATGAMLMGASSREAVKIASKIDIYTGGKIKTVNLLSQRKKP